ncbi:hypothetical protein FOQG_12924 [Fusarium oxysporum f. sp. raphani 54005]|uniref:Fungal N-terminal domain-containing protein n=1 Tax=Fusarium oxysporum f. sp. raphani 54005 TaxID=1089458 RepID=X0BWC8_FUSOX|nr:hypothetical protein FOQG_12924 [Fusarium oxysporum f. sp. raphani 54005]
MAELALAIIPLGITVTSGLVKYLKTFNDHDDDRTRVVRQAERFESTFQSLEAALKRSQLNPELFISASEACASLGECQKALEELSTLQQKIFTTTTSAALTTPHARTKDKIKDGYKKFIYPLRKSDIETLEGALNKLSITLNIALGTLHLLPVLQTSVDAIVPHFDQRFDQISYQHVQMQAQIKSLLDMAGPARYQDRLGTNQQLSYNHSEEQGNYLAAREIEPELRTLAKRADPVSICSCQLQRVRQSKRFALGPVDFAEEMLSNVCHEKDCVFFIPSSGYQKTRTIRFTGLASLLKRGIEVSFSIRAGAGGFSISPSFAYFPVVDPGVAPAFLVLFLLGRAVNLKEINETRSRTILSVAQQKLQELFCSGRASPNDVTQNSSTLLHHLGFSVRSFELRYWLITLQRANSPFVRLTCEGLLNFLVAAGTSVTVRNIYGDLALHGVICGTFVPASIYRQLNPGNDVEDRGKFRFPYPQNRRGLFDYYDHNQSVASIQYGPLGLAVIRNNLLEVERLIALHPHMLDEEVPDIDAIEMDRFLRKKGIIGLGPLSTFADEDLPQQPWQDVGYYSRPIFFDLETPGDADLFVDCDFKIICADEDYCSSLDRARLNKSLPWIRSISPNYAIWLFDHQAPLWKWSYRFTSPMPSIFVLADILGMEDYKVPGQDKGSDRAERYLSESALVDNCSCLCSPDGCTPFTSRMKWLAHPHDRVEDLAHQDLATHFSSHAEIYGKSLNLSHHVIMMRQATFAALDLNHTCLDRPGYTGFLSHTKARFCLDPLTELEPDEIEFEILNVDVEAMNQLKEVVVMFQDFVLTGRQTTISSKSGSFDIDYSAFNEPSALGIDDLYYQRVLEFWKHIWANRIQVALDTIAKRWDNKLDGLNDLVQVLTSNLNLPQILSQHSTSPTTTISPENADPLAGLDSIDWSQFSHAYGPADNVPRLLKDLQSTDPKVYKTAFDKCWSNIYHQGSRYSASVEAVPFLYALIDSPATKDHESLLYLIVSLAIDHPDWAIPNGIAIQNWEKGIAEIEKPEYRDRATQGFEAYQTVEQGLSSIVRFLDEDSASMRANAAHALAFFPLQSAASRVALLDLLSRETNNNVSATIILALAVLFARVDDDSEKRYVIGKIQEYHATSPVRKASDDIVG